MSKLGKIVKDTVKAKKESVMGKLGDAPFEDPMEPWSAKYDSPVKEEVEDLTEDSVLYRYIRSKGYSPEHMDFAHRSAFARSRAFKTYKIMHQRRKEREAQGGIHDIKAVRKEEVNLAEAGVGGLMNFIRSKGLDPTSMDGNHKKHYSRSSEYRVFKTIQPDADEAKAKHKEREKAKEGKKKVNETSGMGERGDDWNEETTVKVKVKKPYTHEVFHIKSGKVLGKYTSSSTAHRGADKHDNNYGGYAHAVRPIKEEVDEEDTVTMDIPLLIRVLEYAREDAKTDMDLHKVVENLINMRGEGTMSMAMYDKIVAIKEAIEEADEAKYGKSYQDMVKRVGEKAKKKPVDIKSLAARMQASYAKDKKPLKELKKQPDNMDADEHLTREGVVSTAKRVWKAISDFDDSSPKYDGNTRRRDALRKKLADSAKKKELKKEEVEQLSELSKDTLKSYIKDRGETIHADKRDSNKARNNAADAQAHGDQKSADRWHDEADWLHKRARKGATNVTKAAIKVAKKPANEEVELDEARKANTAAARAGLAKRQRKEPSEAEKQEKTSSQDSEWERLMAYAAQKKKTNEEVVSEACGCDTRKQQSMKSARMIKSLYKKKLKESTYDWEKDDKGGKKTTAKITVKGGTTMTGQPRDTVEIEPVLKTRPNNSRGMKPGV